MSNVKNYTEQGGERTVIGGVLEITPEGKLILKGGEIKPIENQENSKATTIEDLVSDFNILLSKLKTSGLMKS